MTGKQVKVVVRGAGLDALSASISLSRAGIRHEWEVDVNRIGGHFKGWTPGTCGVGLQDLGMVALEKDTRGASREMLSSYRGEVGAQIRPFLFEAFDFLESCGLKAMPHEITTYVRGREYPDYFISDCLDAFDLLSGEARETAIAELEERRGWDRAISNKLAPSGTLDSVSLSEALGLTIGPKMRDEFFSDYLDCLVPDGNILGSDHRLAWIPLYWPSSLTDFLVSGNRLPKVEFLGFRGEPIANFVLHLTHQAIHEEACLIVPESRRDSAAEVLLDFAQPAPQRSRVPVTIAHFCVSETRPRSVFVASPLLSIFRVSFRETPIGTSAIVEVGGESTTSDHILANARTALWELFGLETCCDGDLKAGFAPTSRPRVHENFFDPLHGAFGANLGLNFNESLVRGLATVSILKEQHDDR